MKYMKQIEECLHSGIACMSIQGRAQNRATFPKSGQDPAVKFVQAFPDLASTAPENRQGWKMLKACWKHVRIIIYDYTSQFFIILLPRSNTLCNKIAAKGMRKITKVRLCWRSWWHRSTPASCHIFPHLSSTFINSIRVSRLWQDRFPFGSWVGSRDNQMSTNRYWQILRGTNR